MTEDFFKVDIPIFLPKYEEEKLYGWSRYKDNLWEVLREATGGYCMYCYDTVIVNEQRHGQIEHGIEKANSEERLSDCIPNLGLACMVCNGKYKKRGEKRRKLPLQSIQEFEMGECRGFACKNACENFRKLRREYIRNGKIILQPFEAKIREDGHCLGLQYDLLKCRYIPAQPRDGYEPEELEIINAHIRLFGLNAPERKNYEVGLYCKNVIDNQSFMNGVKYNNLVVNLFREKLQYLKIEEAVKICKIIYMSAFMQLAT